MKSPDSLSPDSLSPDSLNPDSLSPDSPIPSILAAIALGLGLSAFFWLPAFGERNLIRLSGITSGFFDFRHNFISLAELLALPRPLDLSAINPYYPLSLGLAQIAFAALSFLGLGLYYVIRTYVSRTAHGVSPIVHGRFSADSLPDTRAHAIGDVLFFAVALLVAAFLTLPHSQPVWEAVPLLELAEFPWRWLGPAILCAAVLAGAALYMLEELGSKGWRSRAGSWGLGIGLVFTLAANLFYLFPAQFIPWGSPTPADAVAYEAESGAIGTTSTGEFLPRWADRYPSPDVLSPDYAAGRPPTKLDPASRPQGAATTTLSYTARETRIAVSSPVSFFATFRALYWPGWRVIIEGPSYTGERATIQHPAEDVQITRPDGLIRAHLPAGEYHVSLHLFPTPIRWAGAITSVLSLLAFLGLILAQSVDWKIGRLVAWKIGRLENWKIGKGALFQPSNLPTFQSSRLPPFQAAVISAALIVGLLVTRPLADWFRVQSPLDSVYGAQYTLRADFGDQVRLLAFDLPTREGWEIGRLGNWRIGRLGIEQPSSPPADQPTNLPISQSPNLPISQSPSLPELQAKAGGSLPVVLYWRALVPLATDYHVFVHLNAPDGRTYASVDERHPEDIPTSHWPPSLYLRNPLTIALPPDLPPIRYTLAAGIFDPQTGARLPVTGCDGCPPTEMAGDTLPLAYVWLLPKTPLDEEDIPRRLDYRLGDQITLLGYDLTPTAPTRLILYWRAEAQVSNSYTVFIHALDADGEIIAQFDAPPLNGLYPSDAWLPGQLIADGHSITLPESAQTLAVGLYDPNSLVRLPVIGRDARPIPNNVIRLQVANGR